MKWIFLIVFGVVSAQAGFRARDINCLHRRDGFVISHWRAGAIGQSKYSFSNLEDCRRSIEASMTSQEPLVCTPTQNGFELTHWQRLAPLADANFLSDFRELNSCLEAVRSAQKGLSCAWTGRIWSIFSTSRAQLVGRSEVFQGRTLVYGFSTFENCLRSLSHSTLTQICNWNGVAYQAYGIDDSQVDPRWQAESLDECVKVLNNSEINNQEGKIL